MSSVLSILSPIFVFGIVIFVHELGHFLAAKSVGVYTPRFSIGFGPALWRRRRGETEYILAAFPLGGYVRMASRHDETAASLEGGSEEAAAERNREAGNWDPEAMIPFGPKPVPENRWFESKPLWARLYILIAGVTMNFVLGLVVAIGLAMHFGKAVIPTRVVGLVRPIEGKNLLSSVVQPGDTIVHVNGQPVKSWSAAINAISETADSLTIGTNRGTVLVEVNRPGAPSAEDVAGAIDPQLPPVIGDLVAGEPASKAGFKPGDSVVTINGAPIRYWGDLVVKVAGSTGEPLSFEVARDSTARQTLTVTPKAMDGIDPITGERKQVGKIGAYPPDITAREPVSIPEAFSLGTRSAWGMATSIVVIVRDLFTRKVALDQLGGPIAITRASVQAARAGMEYFFGLIALLSINVAILNLLPIPILDGGQILINVLESARGRAFSLRTREYILRGGLFVILLLFVIVMFNDTRGLFR
jgi:regulator of sigma E protease